jgi:hypothetical protein
VDEVTWVFDAATGLWHKRSHIDHGRHHASSYVRAFDKHIIGDYSTGKLYQWSLDIYDDAGRPMIAEAVCAPIHRLRDRMRFKSFEVDIDAGVGLTGAGVGIDPQIVMEFSDDKGKTWSNERPRPMGKLGCYLERAIWYRLGQGRDRRFRIRISDPVKRAILGTAYVEAAP